MSRPTARAAALATLAPALDEAYDGFNLAHSTRDPIWTVRRFTDPADQEVVAFIAAVLAFGRGLGEFGATAVLAGNIEGRTRTIALAVYSALDAPDGEETLRWLLGASLLLALGSLLGFEALQRAQRRRLGLDDG